MHGKLAAAARHPDILRWEREREAAEAREQEERVVFDRELFYAIQPEDRLARMIERYGVNSRCERASRRSPSPPYPGERAGARGRAPASAFVARRTPASEPQAKAGIVWGVEEIPVSAVYRSDRASGGDAMRDPTFRPSP
jgi:hypothetical protein